MMQGITLLLLSTVCIVCNAFSVTVVGGTGFVGSRVCKFLVESENEVKVTSVSKTGKVPDWCSSEEWTKSVSWMAADLTTANAETLDKIIGAPEAMVSCVGVVGTEPDFLLEGNGKTSQAAFASAKRGGAVKKTVLVSVASEVAACRENWLPEFFGGYFDGKQMAEEAARDAVGGESSKICVIKPSFIYGGDSFGLLPPRVNQEYGSAVEELLSFKLIQSLADVTPGLIKVALRPPSSVDAVAAACVVAATGELSGVLDGGSAINAATNQPAATGLTDFLQWAKENSIEFYDWAKVELPKAIEQAKGKIDEVSKK